MGKQFHGEAANFPGAPKNFDPQNPYADGVAMIQQREHIVREKMIQVETAKVRSTPPRRRTRDAQKKPYAPRPMTEPLLLSSLVPQLLRERVQKCYQLEGVNHYQNCKEEVKAYLESIKNVGVHRANIGANDKSPV